MQVIKVGTNSDGTPRNRYELTADERAAGYAYFVTGPFVGGVISAADGSIYDISEPVIAVKKEHVGEMHLAIHKMHHAAGRFLDHPVPALEDVSLPVS